jgi:hypothetical protein
MEHSFTDWLSGTPVSQAIQLSPWAIPGIQTIHILALAVLFSAALVLSMRVLGRGIAAEPLASVAARFLPPIGICLVLLLVTGTLLIIAEPARTIANPVFYIKMGLLAFALGTTLYLRGAARSTTPLTGAHSAAAVAVLLLWAAIMVAGRYIAYIEPF